MKPHQLKDDDPHRLRCPQGHSSWEPVNGGFWCAECCRRDKNASFKEVRDRKTGERLDREDVRELEEQLQEAVA